MSAAHPVSSLDTIEVLSDRSDGRRLGAHWQPDGSIQFAVYSQHAEAVDLVLFHPDDPDHEAGRIRLTERNGYTWHVAVLGLSPGWRFGYRVHGQWMPEWGLFFNADKLLLDPYATRIDRASEAHPWMVGTESADFRRHRKDSAPVASKAVIRPADDGFDWQGDSPPDHPLEDTVIYEAHVKGFTQKMGGVPEDLRGSYAGLGHEAAIGHLKHLGITAVQLLPVHQHLDDDFLGRRGLVNYWGYNTIGFFAPETRYAISDDPVTEFKGMVKSLHDAGIEVILDVVYNHTGEAGTGGPMINLRGFENSAYYRTRPKFPEQYVDYTGCGNTVNVPHPQALRLVLDSLRYWVEEMHVDGFRFDLGVTLGREPAAFNPQSAFFKAIASDPVLSRVKMIAEPWDLGRGGYQVGGFPSDWAELNGKYRDCVRRFWKGDSKVIGEFASRITGSEDLFRHNDRRPGASVNFITSHDGFPLHDLVSYNDKHNEANGEENRDGDSHNLSWNHGTEGPTDDPEINALRERQARNFLATLFLSQGAIFILGGDEFGRTQGGNNNGYCQDNEISWFDWERSADFWQRREFVRRLGEFRRQHEVLRRRDFFTGDTIAGRNVRDMLWFTPAGEGIDQSYWTANQPGALSVVINRNAADHRHNGWRRRESDTLLLIFNARDESIDFLLPGGSDIVWELVIDTTDPEGFVEAGTHRSSYRKPVTVADRSLQAWVLREGRFGHCQEFATS